MLVAVAATVTASCSPAPRALNDSERAVQTVLRFVGAANKGVCVDDRTSGEALAVFREMIVAPPPSRAVLRWRSPRPLQPEVLVTTKEIRSSELGGDRFTIAEPEARRDELPGTAQMALTGSAQYMSRGVGVAKDPVVLRSSWTPANVTARWWLANRLNRSCWPLFLISDPVRDRERAFVAVRSEHWGTLYALKRTPAGWTVEAEWSRWLY